MIRFLWIGGWLEMVRLDCCAFLTDVFVWERGPSLYFIFSLNLRILTLSWHIFRRLWIPIQPFHHPNHDWTSTASLARSLLFALFFFVKPEYSHSSSIAVGTLSITFGSNLIGLRDPRDSKSLSRIQEVPNLFAPTPPPSSPHSAAFLTRSVVRIPRHQPQDLRDPNRQDKRFI